MAKANQYHRGGNTYRRTTQVKVPVKDREHNKEKWKERELQKQVRNKNKWWKRKKEIK